MQAKLEPYAQYLKSIINEISEGVSTRLSLKDYLKLRQSQWDKLLAKGSFSLFELEELAESLGFGYHTFLSQNIDVEAVVQKVLGNEHWIPRQYQRAAYSSSSITQQILNVVQVEYGSSFLKNLMAHFQLPAQFLQSEPLYICSKLNADIFSYIEMITREPPQIAKLIATKTASFYKDQAFGQKFCGLNIGQCYEILSEEIFSNYEKSHQYKLIKLNSSGAVFRKNVSDALIEEFKSPLNCSNLAQSLYIAGILEQIPTFAGQRSCKVKLIKSEFRGDSSCDYYIQF